jgi:hypothetical protein
MDNNGPRLRHRISRPVEVGRCACADRMCLFHYDRLDPGRQRRERVRAGVQEPYIGSRR